MADPKKNGNNTSPLTPVEPPTVSDQPETAVESAVLEDKAGRGWREIIRQALANERQNQPATNSQSELKRDKTKGMLVLAGAAVLMLLFFLSFFSSPQRAKKAEAQRRPGAPDLGRRVTPGTEKAQPGSVTPVMNAQVSADQGQNKGDVTPEDIDRTARAGIADNLAPPPAPAAKKDPGQYALGRIDFDSALAATPGYGVGPAYQHSPAPSLEIETAAADLRKPSLVFVRAAETSGVGGSSVRPVAFEQTQFLTPLPAGTRLVARLESAVSTVAKEPVIAVIEYNYERDGQIVVPAGAKAIGQLRQANRSGDVDVRFDKLDLPDGTVQSIDGVAMGFDFGPLKGEVAGKNAGKNFLVRAFTGLGTAAAYLVGNPGSSGYYGPISESSLLRERVADNIGIAGDEQLNEIAYNQNIVVTVPGNARFYIVLETGLLEGEGGSKQAAVPNSARQSGTALPTLDDLRQLVQLRQELSTLYQQGTALPAANQAPQ